MPRPLTCTRCSGPCEIAEDIAAVLEWGLAVVDDDGVIRLADPEEHPPTVMADNGDAIGRPRACCTECGHQWRLRRRFDPIAAPAAT